MKELATREKKKSFTLAFHPHNHAVKSINLKKNFKLIQNNPDAG